MTQDPRYPTGTRTTQDPPVEVFGRNLEDSVVGTWFARLGVLAVLVGAAYGYRYAVDQGWIGPAARVLLGVLLGGGFVAGGHVARRRGWIPFGSALSGGGISILYLSTLAALVRYELIDPATGLVALSAVALLGGALSVAYDSLPLSVLATVGAFANPFLISSGEPNAIAALTYVVAVDLGILYLAYAGRWPLLNKLSLVGTAAVFGSVIFELGMVEGLGFGAVLWLLFSLVPFMQATRTESSPNALDAGVVVTASGLFFAAGMIFLLAEDSIARGAFTIALATGCAAFAALAATDERTRPLLRDVMGAQAIAWFTLAVPILIDGPAVSLVWSVQGTLLLWLSTRTENVALRIASMGLVLVGILGAVDHISTYEPYSLLLTGGGAVAVAQIASLFVAAAVLLRDERADEWMPITGSLLLGLAGLLLLAVLSRETGFEVRRRVSPDPSFGPVQFAYSLIWSGYAAVLLGIGIARRLPAARYFAIGLFAVTILKMVTVDVWQLDEIYRMVAFVGLGALLLVCSLMYNRFRDLIVEGAARPPDATPTGG